MPGEGGRALEGKVALVTGGGTGIGRGIATMFAEAGAKVVIASRREAPLKVVAESAPGRITYELMDITRAEDRTRVLNAIEKQHSGLDILVNNAAYQLWKTFEETTEAEIDELFLTNLSSITRLIKQAMPLLQARRGNIVNISSTASHYTTTPSQKLSVYSASKAALNQLTRTLAPEFGPMGVRINAVAPGLTRGEYAGASLVDDPATDAWITASTALGRMGEPEDIAKVALFLASDQASWVTGQVIDASGGWQISAS